MSSHVHAGAAVVDLTKFMCPTDARNLARLPRMQDIYDALARIARAHAPRTVCEIGVRAGYSAYVWMTESPNAKVYLGIDMDDQARYGGPWLWHARKLLDTLDVEWTIWEKDTQKMRALPEHRVYPEQSALHVGGDVVSPDISVYRNLFDLIHVDGDHTYEGCMHDMKMCWPTVAPGGVMVVDDATYLPGPVRAVREFTGTVIGAERIYLEQSPTGSMVFVKEGA